MAFKVVECGFKWNMAASWSPVGSSALCMWGMVSMAFLHACSLSLCLFLLFLSVPCLSFCPFHSSMFWWRSMVLHVLVKDLSSLGFQVLWVKLFECKDRKLIMWCFFFFFKMGQIVLTDHFSVLFQIRWVQVDTQDSIWSKQNATCENLNCLSVVNRHPPKPRLSWYCCLTQVRYCHSVATQHTWMHNLTGFSTICRSVVVSYTH